jgi:hypothetical protein
MAVTLTTPEDSMNLRCYQQVERFGIELLYPAARYVEALTKPMIRPRPGGPVVPNPIFQNPDGAPRTAGQVLFAGVVGVPWQDVSQPEDWNGDSLTFLSADELASQGRWDVILGDPNAGIAPTDALMVESIDPRPESPHPLLDGVSIVGPTVETNENPINGHEQAVLAQRDDLQFACIYPLEKPVKCNAENSDTCDCNSDEAAKNSPLCSGTQNTVDGTQVYGKAYPAVRELRVLRGVGSNAVVTSACPKQTGAASDSPLNGYQPALAAVARGIGERLAGDCLPSALPIDQCLVLEARQTDACSCDPATGRRDPNHATGAVLANARLDAQDLGYDAANLCLCEIAPLTDDALDRCDPATNGTTGPGYCYLDGNGAGAALLEACPADKKLALRFASAEPLPAPGALTFLSCGGG